VVSIGRKPGIGPRLSPLLLLNKGGRVRSLRLLASLMQALYTPILLPSIARPIWNYRSLQQLHVSIYLACSILLNFLICSQLIAEMGCSVAEAGACYKEGGISAKVGIGAGAGIGARAGIGTGVGIGASPGKDEFRPSWMPLLALSVVYSGGVGE
jgi:hypothetical protein